MIVLWIIGAIACIAFMVLLTCAEGRRIAKEQKFISDAREFVREKYDREPTEYEDLLIRMCVYYD